MYNTIVFVVSAPLRCAECRGYLWYRRFPYSELRLDVGTAIFNCDSISVMKEPFAK